MVKPPLRTKSIGFKVSEEEYAQLETAAQASGRTLGEWCREVILRGGCQRCSEARSGAGRDRRSPLAAGQRVGACGGGREAGPGEVQQNARPNQRSEARTRRQVAAAGGQEETAARKTQRRREAVISHFFAGECTERGSHVKGLRYAPMNAQRTRGLDSPPSPLLCCFQLGKNEKRNGRGNDALWVDCSVTGRCRWNRQGINQADDRALVPFRRCGHALKSPPKSPTLRLRLSSLRPA